MSSNEVAASHGPAGVEDLWTTPMCLDALSKDLTGSLELEERDVQGCGEERRCTVSKTRHRVQLEVVSHAPCDSRTAEQLDGRLEIVPLVTVLAGRGLARGPHRGTFEWIGNAVLVRGQVTGTTNVGTHREPALDPCQECDAPHTLEGQLDGVVVRAEDERLLGRTVSAAYRLRLDPSGDTGDAHAVGTLEGVVVRECRELSCIDLAAVQPGQYPNPWTIDGHTFEVVGLNGVPSPDVTIGPVGNQPATSAGVYLGRSTTITLAQPTGYVTLTLSEWATAPVVTGLDASGAVVAVAQPTVGPVVLVAPDIASVVITAPQEETWLTSLCVAAARRGPRDDLRR